MAERTRLRSTVENLEASVREDRRRMRDLQYEIARLTRELKSAEPTARHGPSPADDEPILPVEVLTPDGGEGPANPLARATGEDIDLVGSDGDGVEIVYVGDAAKDRSVEPDTTYLRPRPPAPATHAAKRQLATHRHRGPLALSPDPGDERIELTDDVGPTVARQLAQVGERAAIDRKPAIEPSPRQAAAPVQQKRPPAPTRPATDPGPASDPDPRTEYARYYEALRAGNHGFAIAGFSNFIERHPGHSYADNARYWLAEAHYDKRDYRVALDEFRKVERDYPRGNKVPDSLLKIAYCHIALSEHGQARTVMARLIERFPRSHPAELAKERLAALAGK